MPGGHEKAIRKAQDTTSFNLSLVIFRVFQVATTNEVEKKEG
jgi:hypothetical protein